MGVYKKQFHWKYKNLSILVLVLLIVFVLGDTGVANPIIEWIGDWGYLGALAVGVFFVSFFTVIPSSVILIELSQNFNPIAIALCGGAGAMVGDLVIFHFLKDGLFEEIKHLIGRAKFTRAITLFKSKYVTILTPFVGAFIIASPFPDEIGIGLMGLSNIKQWQFLMLSFVLNAGGIFVIVSVL